MNNWKKVGLGGGCHWCTEAVFASLKGVEKVEQGWIASKEPYEAFSEAVVVTYDPATITLADLIEIHVHTHASTANHSMRQKYRSAVYSFTAQDAAEARTILQQLQPQFEKPFVTMILPFVQFRLSVPEQLNYYYSDKEKPFCKLYIHPKIQLLRKKFARLATDSSSLEPSHHQL